MPKPGAFVRFADPDETALDAGVFWHTCYYRHVTFAHVGDACESGFSSVIRLGEIRCDRTLLKTCVGEQHILLRTLNRVAQLRCTGGDIRADPFAIELIVAGFPDIEDRLRQIKLVADLYRNRHLGGRNADWTVEAMRHRDALAACDLRCRGRSYRELAVFLYGKTAVEEDWTNPNQTMKNRVIRSVKRGTRMVEGDYRKLLA